MTLIANQYPMRHGSLPVENNSTTAPPVTTACSCAAVVITSRNTLRVPTQTRVTVIPCRLTVPVETTEPQHRPSPPRAVASLW